MSHIYDAEIQVANFAISLAEMQHNLNITKEIINEKCGYLPQKAFYLVSHQADTITHSHLLTLFHKLDKNITESNAKVFISTHSGRNGMGMSLKDFNQFLHIDTDTAFDCNNKLDIIDETIEYYMCKIINEDITIIKHISTELECICKANKISKNSLYEKIKIDSPNGIDISKFTQLINKHGRKYINPEKTRLAWERLTSLVPKKEVAFTPISLQKQGNSLSGEKTSPPREDAPVNPIHKLEYEQTKNDDSKILDSQIINEIKNTLNDDSNDSVIRLKELKEQINRKIQKIEEELNSYNGVQSTEFQETCIVPVEIKRPSICPVKEVIEDNEDLLDQNDLQIDFESSKKEYDYVERIDAVGDHINEITKKDETTNKIINIVDGIMDNIVDEAITECISKVNKE